MIEIAPDRSHRLLAPRLVYLIGSRSARGAGNIMPATNVTSICTDPELVGIAVYREWETCANLLSSSGWSLSLPRTEQLDVVWKLGGRYSGYSSVSKLPKVVEFADMLNDEFSSYGPVLGEAIAWLECRTIKKIDDLGDHILFIGQVTKAAYDPRVYGPAAAMVSEAKPIMQWSQNRFSTSEDSFRIAPYSEMDPC